MHPREFHEKIDQERLIAALSETNRKTAGRVYVYVSHRHIEDAMAAARARFEKLGLSKIHEDRASVLIYLAPHTHKFAIVGDTAIHERCGEDYWKKLAEELSRDLKAEDLTTALLNAVWSLKGTLEEHFPAGGLEKVKA